MVSEYKTKLQIAEAENARLEGLVRIKILLCHLSCLLPLSPLQPPTNADQPSSEPGDSLQEPGEGVGRERGSAHEGKETPS